MDCKKSIITNVILSTLVGGSAWAQNSYNLVDGQYTLLDDLNVSGLVRDSGIWGSGVNTTISTGKNIELSGNNIGMFIRENATVEFIGLGESNLFSATNSGREGFLINANLTISGMDVNVSGNGNSGLQATEGGSATIKEASSVKMNNNTGHGILAYNNGNKTSYVNISGKDDGNSLLQVNNNSDTGIQSDNNAQIDINNMHVTVNENGEYGFSVKSGGQANIIGSGSHLLAVSGNGKGKNEGAGVVVRDHSQLNISGMDINVSDNGPYGIRAVIGGVITITGQENNKLTVSKNNSRDENRGDGILAESVDSNRQSSTITLKEMNISVNDQAYQGIAARHGGVINIIGKGVSNVLEVYNTRMKTLIGNGDDAGKGIHARDSDMTTGNQSVINIKDMNVIANENEREGVVAAMSGVITLSSTSGKNTLVANDNKQYTAADDWTYGAGLLAHGISEHSLGQRSAIIINNMSVQANNNGLYGLYARDGGLISLTGDGSHTLELNGNKSNGRDNYDAGIAIEGLLNDGSSDIAARIAIKNMDVTLNDNGRDGINVASGGQLSVSSTKGNSMTISGNRNADNSGNGIAITGVFNDTASRLDIRDMNVAIDGSPDAGIKVSEGALVNIVSSRGNNTLKANANDNHGTQYNEGVGLFALDKGGERDARATLNIAGMNIEAKNNGSYGVLSEGAYVNIWGNGSRRLNVEGNGRYGLIAKDGGIMDIAGMQVSGNSLGHSLVAVEREGEIAFSHSNIVTGNDSLFYAWSESDAETSKISLDNSIAIGNGTKLAWFAAHNGVLNATESYLENAIGTSTDKGISSTVSLQDSVWAMKDSSNITHFTSTRSLTDMRKKDGYTTLTLGSLTSEHSSYRLNTYFDQPGLTTDKIIVDGGAATGDHNVLRVTSTGYADGTNVINGYGIQVVNLDTATNKSVDFALYGGVVDSGAYHYHLYRAEDENYYLQTDHTPTTTAKSVANIPSVQLAIVKAGMNELRHRVTELREHDIFHPDEVWVRTYGKHLKVDDTIETKMDLYGIELGYDKEIHQNEKNNYYAGLMAGYLYADNIKHRNSGYPDGSASANTPGVGVYGVWDNRDGWYAYGTLRYFWSRMKAQNTTSAGEPIHFNPNRNFVAATLELGKQNEKSIDEKSKWIIEPKAELGYAVAGSKSFKTNINTEVHYGASESFTTRAALLLGYNNLAESGSIYEPFVEVGVNREWLGKTDVRYAGANFHSDQRGNGVDVAVGLRAKTSENWSFVGNLGYEKGEVTQGFGGQLGVRYSW
ncbi:autotransporter outer membrane beta-barrel domain-containing protein [Enterobacteriaceae bacterium RIT691]|nr:autotransporter outer membrane beta-barrel domain-containing protein [Enterobacteriaceae bacterium RIT691]